MGPSWTHIVSGHTHSAYHCKLPNAAGRAISVTSGGSTETLVDASGTVVDPTGTYHVTVNNFMADDGDGYSTFLKGTKRLGGAQDIDALVAFLSQYKAPRSPYNPATVAEDADTPRIRHTGSSTIFPTGANVNP